MLDTCRKVGRSNIRWPTHAYSLGREWEHFGSNEPCPYHFSAEAIREHRAEAESFNENQRFWEGLREILTDEGYTSNETFSTAVEVLKNLRDAGLARLKSEERHEFARKTNWVLELNAQV